jgi:hypothetical protein
MDRMSLYSPRPQVPFPGLSLNGLCNNLRNIQSPSWNNNYRHHGCNLMSVVTGIVNAATTDGLSITEMKKDKRVSVAS